MTTSRDTEVDQLRIESLRLIVEAEALLGRLEAHQESLEHFLHINRPEGGSDTEERP